MAAWEEIAIFDETVEPWTEEERDEFLADLYPDLRYAHRERQLHDRSGWFAEEAGSAACKELGHSRPENGWGEDYDAGHVQGWEGSWLCEATKYGSGCTYCEDEDCEASASISMSTCREFWDLFSAQSAAVLAEGVTR